MADAVNSSQKKGYPLPIDTMAAERDKFVRWTAFVPHSKCLQFIEFVRCQTLLCPQRIERDHEFDQNNWYKMRTFLPHEAGHDEIWMPTVNTADPTMITNR